MKGVDKRMVIVWVLTQAYLLAMFGIGPALYDAPEALNEVGDLLAGVFAPLAFLWLVVGLFMQREELELQRAELRANTAANNKQADELLRQADFLDAQTLVMKADLEEKKRQASLGSVPLLAAAANYINHSGAELVITNRGAAAYNVTLTDPRGWELESAIPRLPYPILTTDDKITLRLTRVPDFVDPAQSYIRLHYDVGSSRSMEATFGIYEKDVRLEGVNFVNV